MKSLKFKILLMIVIIGIFTLAMPILSYGANNELAIVEKSDSEYMIYLKDYLTKEFEFAFSNNSTADVATLKFIPSALDAEESGANNIAYVDNTTVAMFANPTYMWVKADGEIKISAVEIDIQDSITITELENVGKVSKTIPVKLEQKDTVTEVEKDDKTTTTTTTTVGIVKLVNELANGKYQLIKREATTESDNLFALAELIEKNDFTDSYTRIKASKEFVELYNKQYGLLNTANWKAVENGIIEQPADAKNGEQYILWVKGDNAQDVHFLTSVRIDTETKETVKEEIITKLPVTYDDNRILIALAVVIVAIVLVSIRIAVLKKKEMNK